MRPILSGLCVLILGSALMAGCGRTITITLPGAPGGTAATAAPQRPGPSGPPRGYARPFSPAPHAFRPSQGAEPVRRGQRSERFELREGDCGGADCGQARARAEIAQGQATTKARLDRDIWYGWSFYNATMGPVTRERSLGTVLGQWKLEGDVPASFRLIQVAKGENDLSRCDPRICTPGGSAADDVMLELDEMAQAGGWGAAQNQGRICRLFDLGANRGRWVDLVVNTNFGTDGYGYLRVWVNGALRCDYRGQVVSVRAARAAGAAGPTDRRGIFNSFTGRWTKAFGAAPKPTQVAYWDEFLSGASRAEVDPRLRAAQGLPPVD